MKLQNNQHLSIFLTASALYQALLAHLFLLFLFMCVCVCVCLHDVHNYLIQSQVCINK